MERFETVDKFYTCLESVKRKFDKYARQNQFMGATEEEFYEWQKKSRGILEELIGFDKLETCDYMTEALDEVELEGGLVRKKMIIQTEPEVFMPFYIFYPKKENQIYLLQEKNFDKKKPACVIAPHGHCGGGKESIAGRREIPSISDAINKYEYDYGLQLAKMGYITICPDARGFGERREEAFQKDNENSYINGACYQLSHMAEPLGMTTIGMLVWDLMRLVDWIYESKEWDTTELGCVGFSGGGMQTLMLAALDERIKKCVISGYMYGYKDSLLVLNGNCNCNYVPHLWEYFDMGDIGSLIAPRQVCIQSCNNDHLNGSRGLENVNEQVDIMRRAYSLLGAEDLISQDIREGGHSWHGEVLQMVFAR